MKQRNLGYEQKFRKYLYSFDWETHKKICKNINLRHNEATMMSKCPLCEINTMEFKHTKGIWKCNKCGGEMLDNGMVEEVQND